MSLLRTSLLNGISVLMKVLSALALNKILAIYVGPSGYAVIGQLQNAVAIASNVAGGAIATGVTRATAQHFDDSVHRQAVWRTATRITLLASAITAFGLILFHEPIAERVLQRQGMMDVILWLALAVPAVAFNNLLLAILNGKKEVRLYVISNIAGSVIGLLIAAGMTVSFGLHGAFVAFVLSPAAVLLVTALLVTRKTDINLGDLFGKFDRQAAGGLASYGLMGLTTAIAAPASIMAIREILSATLGLEAAGYWQASWKISEIYLMLITTTLSVYYLPRLAEIRTPRELNAEILKVYKFVLPVALLCACTIYALRDFIILTLFTRDFSPMRDLFFWQLLGDAIKIGSWIPAYIMLGRGMAKVFVISEVSFALTQVLFTSVLVRIFGLVGAPMAYAANYVLYWIFAALLLRWESRKMGLAVSTAV